MNERDRRIKARAFELWQQSGTIDGQSLVHWLQAEQEIKETEEPPVESEPFKQTPPSKLKWQERIAGLTAGVADR